MLSTPLSTLEPHWIDLAGRHGLGVSFLCPHCRQTRLAVWLAHPLDGGPPFKEASAAPGFYLWEHDGDLDNLSLRLGQALLDFPGHWRGHIRKGEVSDG